MIPVKIKKIHLNAFFFSVYLFKIFVLGLDLLFLLVYFKELKLLIQCFEATLNR